jgi:YidC/Oxa1 family membrane protein insertase
VFDFVAYPIGYMLNLVYNSVAFQNYGAAIIILTLIIKIILMPLVIGQQNSSSKLNNIQPELKKIQEKYKDNAEKLSQETMKLYKSQGVNPFASMMSIFIQMPILFSMYHVVSNPMKYMMLGKNELLNMNFFGINLAATPTWSYDKLFGANISNETDIWKQCRSDAKFYDEYHGFNITNYDRNHHLYCTSRTGSLLDY